MLSFPAGSLDGAGPDDRLLDHLEILTMSTSIRSASRSLVATPRDPDVTAVINARRNRGVRRSDTVVIDVPTNVPAEVVVASLPTSKVKKTAESAKSKARRSAAERGVKADVPETDPKTPVKSKKAASKKAKSAPKVKAEPKPKMTSYSVRKDGSLSARDLTCLCGCGSTTVTNDARFISGHDAKLRQAVLSGTTDGAERAALLPKIIRPFFANGETVAGLRLVDGEIEDTMAA